MKTYLLPSLKLTVILLLICSVVYPILIAGISKLAPNGGKGKTITERESIVGYDVIGQSFTQDQYFQGRPSHVGYNAAGSGGSNKGGTNPDYLATVQARIDTFLVHNPGIHKNEIPGDLVTASGSGLDPHISVASARIQIRRIARLRRRERMEIEALVKKHTEAPLLGILGPEKVNVLKLNLALQAL